MIRSPEPLCRICRDRPADSVDHIIPLSAGGTHDLRNLRPLCEGCHNRCSANWRHYGVNAPEVPQALKVQRRVDQPQRGTGCLRGNRGRNF